MYVDAAVSGLRRSLPLCMYRIAHAFLLFFDLKFIFPTSGVEQIAWHDRSHDYFEDKTSVTRVQREQFHFVFRVSTFLSFASSCEVEECLNLFIGRLAALVSLVL